MDKAGAASEATAARRGADCACEHSETSLRVTTGGKVRAYVSQALEGLQVTCPVCTHQPHAHALQRVIKVSLLAVWHRAVQYAFMRAVRP